VTRKRILFYVQHLLGIGHLKRASVIANAMTQRGLDVTIVAGGEPAPIAFDGARVVQLPPIHARDAESYRLADSNDKRIGPLFWRRRRKMLLQTFEEVAPHAVVVEMFPFGRFEFARELIPLLEAAKKKNCARISSMRDIVQPKRRASDNERMVEMSEKYFDRVLIHSDPSLIRIERSLPQARRIERQIHYTGYVVSNGAPASAGPSIPASAGPSIPASAGPSIPASAGPLIPAEAGAPFVIVSIGGGAVGERLLRAAIEARPFTRYHAEPWRLICGMNLPANRVDALKRDVPEGVEVDTHRDDFIALSQRARVSISQAGYNTAMELLASRVTCVFVPFAAKGETEQTERCRVLQERGLARFIAETELTPRLLAQAIDDAQPPRDVAIDFNGAMRSVDLIEDAIGG
jgi:predicted glycosyltransferase